MSLSFWFRDFVFMRMVMVLTRKKVFKNRNVTSSVAYIVNMLIMGFWHGVTWYYIAYGLFHGIGLVINDAWIRKKKTLNKERKKQGKLLYLRIAGFSCLAWLSPSMSSCCHS